MQKVLVLGNSGSGKSTLARQLGQRFGLEVIHLDRIYWLPGWKLRPNEEVEAILRSKLAPEGRWVVDGTGLNMMHVRLPLADTVIVLDLPTTTCLWRVLRRTAIGEPRTDITSGCESSVLRWTFVDFLRYVVTYRRQVLPRVFAKLREIPHCARVVVCRRSLDVVAFLDEEQSTGRSGDQ